MSITAPKIRSMKASGERVVCLTAYDLTSALIADRSGVDLVLVGDSLGNVIQGRSTTLPVSLEDIEYHTRWVSNAIERALVVADLPFGSYQASVEDAVRSSVRLMKAGAAAVKLEGAYLTQIEAIVRAGIPVMGHVGMTPQSVHAFGGFRVQGKGEEAEIVLQAARQVEAAGAFSVVLELIPEALSKRITAELSIPTIGIGAGVGCDGQIQVFHDLLGLTDVKLKHVKRYAELGELAREAVGRYAAEVRSGQFPSAEQSF